MKEKNECQTCDYCETTNYTCGLEESGRLLQKVWGEDACNHYEPRRYFARNSREANLKLRQNDPPWKLF